jgi:asparagine synthase (glutamine-hydrolysing)
MCGIAGIAVRGGAIDAASVVAMGAALMARGPDQEGFWTDGRVAFAHRRLSIIDLTEAGRQPMANETDRVHLVFNGEIYNHAQLRHTLPTRHRWKSRSDSEVLVHGWEEYGPDLVNHIEGMFAFAIHDADSQTLFLARDHFGKKPLYYFHDREIFAFASELKGLLALPEIRRRVSIDPVSVCRFLCYGYIPAPASIFAEVRKLPAASSLALNLATWSLAEPRRYWFPERIRVRHDSADAEALESIEGLIANAVQKRLVADVPVGLFLSGGVDSSVVAAAVASRHERPAAFSIVYRNDPADESAYARRVARQCGLPLTECEFEGQDVVASFRAMLDYLDEPFADPAIVPLHHLSQFARQSVTVALSGDGGDEIFAGYAKYRAQSIIERYGWLLRMGVPLRALFPISHPAYKLLASLPLPFAARHMLFGTGGFMPRDIAGLVRCDVPDDATLFADAMAADSALPKADPINRGLLLDASMLLPECYLVKADRATMATSLELRNPLLDKSLAEYTYVLPGGSKVRRLTTKWHLKALARRRFDRDIIDRPKRGFGVPLDRWIREELRPLFNQYVAVDSGWFDAARVQAMYGRHLKGADDFRFLLYRICVFHAWMERFASPSAIGANHSSARAVVVS